MSTAMKERYSRAAVSPSNPEWPVCERLAKKCATTSSAFRSPIFLPSYAHLMEPLVPCMNLANHFVHTREAQLPQNFECNDQRDNKPAQRSDANDRIKVDCALSLVSPNSHNHLLVWLAVMLWSFALLHFRVSRISRACNLCCVLHRDCG